MNAAAAPAVAVPHSCLGCGAPLPAPFVDLGRTPLANSLIDPAQAHLPEPAFRLAVVYCPGCHLVQLQDLIPPESLFSDYVYFSSYATSYLEHARGMARAFMDRFGLGTSSRVLEIASNDGYLLQYFLQEGVPVLGIEPARNIAAVASGRGIPTLNRFFGPELVAEVLAGFGRADVLIGNNVLAHVPDINGFLGAARECLAPGGAAVFEFPYLRDLLDGTEFDTIYHEHVFYYSGLALSGLARRAGLEFFDVEHQSVHGGSLRAFLGLPGAHPLGPAVARMLAEERAAGLDRPDRYASFSAAVARIKADLLALLGELQAAGRRVAAYGAPAKGNTLLNYCGVGVDLVAFTVDRNPHKQDKLLPGSRIPVLDVPALLERMPDHVLILPWNIAPEIVRQEAEYAGRGGKFIVPIPRVRFYPS